MKYTSLLPALTVVLIVAIVLVVALSAAHGARAKATPISLQSLGQAGVKLSVGTSVVYIDAFAEGVTVDDYGDATMIVVTHADQDHFSPGKVSAALRDTPAIVFANRDSCAQLEASERVIELEPAKGRPVTVTKGDIAITAFRTGHFNGWHAPNNSYLLEIDGRTVYVSGDSYEIDGIAGIPKAELLIQNAIFPASGQTLAVDGVIAKRLKAMGSGSVFLTHLIDCEWGWNVSPSLIQAHVARKKDKRVICHGRVGEITVF